MKWYTVARLSDHQELTPEGFLLVKDVPIARTGTQLYRDFELPELVANGDGWISVDREPSEVFREDSISSFHGKPITDNHPNDVVTPHNWSQLAIGHMQHVRRGGAGNSDVLVADLLFTTSRGINLVRSGKRALSVGYDAYYEQTSPGLARQRNIVANHLALVDEGRCGTRCTIVDGVPAFSDDWLNVDAWSESEHPRGQPGNAGQFAETAGGGGGGEAVKQTVSQRARSLGQSKIAWTPSQRKNAAMAAEALNQAGFRAMTEQPSGSKVDKRFAALGSATNGILVNPRSVFWKDPEGAAKRQYELGHLSTSHPLGVLLHEIAHTQYPDVPGYWPADRQKTIAQKVSRYAATNPKEFVSEVFAGLHTGTEYDADVMQQYNNFTGQRSAPIAQPRLGWQATTPEGKQDYAKIKHLGALVTRMAELDKYESLQEMVTLHDLQAALKELQYLREHHTGKLGSEDKKLAEVLNREIIRRQDVNQAMRQKRADDYAYLDDDEIYEATKVNFGGDSRMKPGMKRQLGLLPVSHIKALQRNGIRVQAVQELPPMSPDHPYAPGMHPAGLFEPATGTVSVADEITLPDGTKRMINQRQAVLRHEVGHAIDFITEASYGPELLAAIDEGVEKMNPMERSAAAYWLGEEYPIQGAHAQYRTRASEMFAELYAYAFDEDADNYTSLGGLSRGRRFELFGKAKQILRKKVQEALGDRTLDWLREAA